MVRLVARTGIYALHRGRRLGHPRGIDERWGESRKSSGRMVLVPIGCDVWSGEDIDDGSECRSRRGARKLNIEVGGKSIAS